VHGADGALTQIVVTFIDISERKAAEAERRLLEQQLREAQKMESIGTLAGGIAHDFNNILAAILGNAALACEDAGADAAVQSSLAQIQKAGLRARSLVQQILTFSRREPGALAVQPLRPVVEETLSLLRATLPAAVQLQAVLPAQTVAVRADATQLQQVLMNLVTNAWHALPAAGGRVEIGFDVVADGHAVHLWVRDNGCGMDEATVARVFDPFFTTKPVGRGTGLGLSVVHGIVRAHHGSIEVTSAPGSGSSFDVYLPTPEHADAAALPRVPGGSAPGHGEHVLLVDDDEVVLVMAERLLQRAGYRVTPVGSARAALQKLQAQPLDFDVVVTDFNMPESSGIELARRVAELRRGLPVVLSSGLVSEELREQARRAGVRAVMKKENSFEELAATVARVLATQR
jgi:nitrogen-specific signal transduction histidine kinase